MVIARYCILFLFFHSAVSSVSAQNKQLDFFIKEALNNNPALTEINNLQQYFHIQNEFITAQNKKPQIS